jgi:hypothetical protein
MKHFFECLTRPFPAHLRIMPNAMPETGTIRENFERYAKATGLTPAERRARVVALFFYPG